MGRVTARAALGGIAALMLLGLAGCGVDGRPVPPGTDPDAAPVEKTPATPEVFPRPLTE